MQTRPLKPSTAPADFLVTLHDLVNLLREFQRRLLRNSDLRFDICNFSVSTDVRKYKISNATTG